MLVQMDDRGPDSAGVAVYRDPVAGRVVEADALLGRPAAGLGRVSRSSWAARSAPPR